MDDLDPENDRTKYYEWLQVTKESTQDEIKKSYRKLALTHHPDKNPLDNGEQMKNISEAYSILSNESLKKIYDNFGLNGIERHQLLAKDPTIAQFTQKTWLYGIAGWAVILLIDYFSGVPFEWFVVLIGTFGALYMIPTHQQRAYFTLFTLIADFILYFIIPTRWLHMATTIFIVTILLAAQNSTVLFLFLFLTFQIFSFDLSFIVWIVAVGLSLLLGLEPSSWWVSLSGAHTISLALVASMVMVLYFNLQYVEHTPSKLLDWFGVISPYLPNISVLPFSVFIVYIPIWILDYFTSLPFEWILYIGLIATGSFINRAKLSLINLCGLFVAFCFVYYFTPDQILIYGTNFLLMASLLHSLYITEDQELTPPSSDKPTVGDVLSEHVEENLETKSEETKREEVPPTVKPRAPSVGESQNSSSQQPQTAVQKEKEKVIRIPVYLSVFGFLIYFDLCLRQVPECWLILAAASASIALMNVWNDWLKKKWTGNVASDE